MPDESLFTALGRYPSSPAVRPLENYTAELVCWLVNSFPSFGCRLAGLLAPARTSFTRVKAETQRAVGASGIVDLVLEAVSSTGRAYRLLVECKIEADIGERDAWTPESDIDVVAGGDPDQIKYYLDYAERRHRITAEPAQGVALISKYPVPVREQWRRSPAWLGAHMWVAVDRTLRACKSHDNGAYAFVADQAHAFFVEHNMAPEKIGSEIRAGTRYRQHLEQMLVRTAETAAAVRGLTASRQQTKWGVGAEWRNRAGRLLGGITYSDQYGDIGIWMDRLWYQTLVDPALLREHRALESAKGPDTDRFFKGFYVPVELDDRFFALDADDQLEVLSYHGGEVLEAFVAVGGTG